LMDAWIGLGGVVLGALIAGGATFLTGKLADDRARQAKRKEAATAGRPARSVEPGWTGPALRWPELWRDQGPPQTTDLAG
ncbi:hypothetical protein, partial [Micrococcus luteus]|uniref:hypothetical protein n=1 Tax=Micrococcus luteus TaxID=1270 RepID=UPI0033C465BE